MTREEKRQILNKRFGFPCRIVLYLSKGEEGFTILASEFRDKKKKLENIRFAEIQAFLLGGGLMTPICVNDFCNADDVINAMDLEAEKWLDEVENNG